MDSSKKLKGKDLINVGVFTAIYTVVIMALAMLGYVPIFMPLFSILMPLFGGIVFMLYLTKVKKFGMILLMSVLMGIIMWLTGMSWYALALGTVAGLIAEFIYKSGEYKSAKKAVLAHGVFSIWVWTNYFPLFFCPEQYWSTRQEFGEEYITKLQSLMPMWMCPVLFVACFIGGILGGWLGLKILKKHFAKAGIV
ncbi:MAG: MptD family putative ECF transporter S component [Treponemataceae bacterium]|nr:MptD family putative ECF transporter S component [Treponemataceae bacterium]